MLLGKIYKRDVAGGIRVWEAETNDIDAWRTHYGTLNGEITTTEWSYCIPRSQLTAASQALFEANAAMKKRLRKDYRKSLDNVDEQRSSLIRPMLAHTYVGWERQCWAQPKLDGMRCLATPFGLWSRNNIKIISAPHIEKSLKDFFKLHPDCILDGELYNHEFHDNFNMIISLARKTKPTLADLAVSEKYLQYHIYDVYNQKNPTLKYSVRREWLAGNIPLIMTIKFVPTKKINSEEDLDLHFIDMLQAGYEGQMIRYDHPYEQKRSSYLLKRKEFIDEEFELINIEEGDGNWSGYAKIATCVSKDGKVFGAGISGTQNYCLDLLRDKRKYKSVTIKYHALTPDGVPRFPIATKFHEEEFSELEKQTVVKPRKDFFS